MISILLPDLRGGGVERIRLVLAREFARMGHDVEFVLMQARGELLEEARASFEIVDLGCDRMRQMPSALARYLRARRPDAVVAAMWPMTSLLGQQLKYPLAMGMVLPPRSLKNEKIVRRGEQIILVASAGSMEVRMNGTAMEDASMGEKVKVKNSSSQRVVEGIVHAPGIVRVTM